MPLLNINMSNNLLSGLEKISKSTGFDKSIIIEKALQKYLLEIKEDIHDSQTAEKAWKDFIDSKEELIPGEELYKKLNI